MSEFFASVKLLLELAKAVRELIAFVDANRQEKWFQDSIATFKKLREAQTADEKKDAARAIADLIGRL